MALSRTDTRAKTAVSGAKSSPKLRTFRTSIDIKAAARETLIALLNQQLADCFDLYSQTKQAHWNVKGSDFIQLHALFDDLAEGILGFVDMIAERATALGGYATGTARMSAANSSLPEYPTSATLGKDHLGALVARFAAFGESTRKAIDTSGDLGDLDTADLFTEVSREIDKNLWFLEAHLQP
jgi:starvation-inducible DNA-binding protein